MDREIENIGKMTMCTESEYRAIVDRYASAMENFEIPNGKPENARYLIAKLFSVGKNHARLYTGSLTVRSRDNDQEIEIYGWPELIDSVEEFLRQDKAKLDIIVQKSLDCGIKNHPLLSRLRNAGLFARDKIRIHKLKEDDSLYQQGERHFLTIDDRSYRMEMKDSGVRAVANFNDRKVTSTLISIFDRVFPRTEPLFPQT